MAERDEFRRWVDDQLVPTGIALHRGEPGPRGDAAWTVKGEPTSYTLRATQIYRRENGGWRVCHRHGDGLDVTEAPTR
jgi:hypothetical protein